eukprot:2042566-Prymnesium_polylepis.2
MAETAVQVRIACRVRRHCILAGAPYVTQKDVVALICLERELRWFPVVPEANCRGAAIFGHDANDDEGFDAQQQQNCSETDQHEEQASGDLPLTSGNPNLAHAALEVSHTLMTSTDMYVTMRATWTTVIIALSSALRTGGGQLTLRLNGMTPQLHCAHRRCGLIKKWSTRKAMLTRSATRMRACSDSSPISSTQPRATQGIALSSL